MTLDTTWETQIPEEEFNEFLCTGDVEKLPADYKEDLLTLIKVLLIDTGVEWRLRDGATPSEMKAFIKDLLDRKAAMQARAAQLLVRSRKYGKNKDALARGMLILGLLSIAFQFQNQFQHTANMLIDIIFAKYNPEPPNRLQM